ncbi:hypothetical protein D1007_42829 [Hordeum vulgare]|nr:hypothetical protein D1007_42829 [Hordeum vulgare]
MRRRFHIHTVYPVALDGDADEEDDDGHRPLVHCSVRVVGSGNGRFALAVDQKHGGNLRSVARRRRMIFLVEPRSGEEVVLVSPTRDYKKNETPWALAPMVLLI